jgi:hypothetical protein
VFRRVGQVIFAPNHVRDLHLYVVNDIHEVKNPRPVWTPDCHIGLHAAIEFDATANQVIDHDRPARRSETHRSVVYVDRAFGLEFL